jgi:SAM-dependent methyltransferase
MAQNVLEFSAGNTEYAAYINAQAWKTRGKQFTNTRFQLDAFVDLILNQCADLPKDPKILSIGSRNHFELDALSDRGLTNVQGVDLWSTDSRVVKGDMHDLPFEDSQFDLIFASHVFEHSYDFPKVAQQCLRVLKPAGYLFAAFPIGYEVGEIDRVDFGTYENFVKHFPSEPQMVICQPAVGSMKELRIILKFDEQEEILLAA